jgi:hypothetical protein
MIYLIMITDLMKVNHNQQYIINYIPHNIIFIIIIIIVI